MSNKLSIWKNSNTEVSFKFGFMGLGMGGTSIAAACADINTDVKNERYPYTGLLVNTNKMDLDVVESKNPSVTKLLIGDGHGAGRDIEIGKQLFKQEEEKIMGKMKEQFKHTDFLWIVAGLGGGTGTGSIIEAVRLAVKIGFGERFGLIVTIPRLYELGVVMQNALVRFKQIIAAMNNGSFPTILVDNEKLHQTYREGNPKVGTEDSLQFINQYVAESLHEVNVITSSFKPVGDTHFDSSEFKKALRTPGFIHFARYTAKGNDIDSTSPITYVGQLRSQIEKGVLSEGYDLTNPKKVAISVLASESTADRLYDHNFTTSIEEVLREISPFVLQKPVARYKYPEGDNRVFFFAMYSGLKMPERIDELIEEQAKLMEQIKAKEAEKTVNPFDRFQVYDMNEAPATKTNSFDDLFGDDSKEEAEQATKVEDQFSNMFGDDV